MENAKDGKQIVPTAEEPTVTFRCLDVDGNEHEVSVKSGWFRQEPKPDITKNIQQIIIDHNILPYLHNPVGPAMTNLTTSVKKYFLNGKPLTDEEGAKLQHNHDFNEGLAEVLGIKA